MEATNTPDEFGWLLEVNHFGEWRKQMRSYSLLTNTVLKISGFAGQMRRHSARMFTPLMRCSAFTA